MKKRLPIFLLVTHNLFAQPLTIDVFSCYDSRSEISVDECTNNEVDIVNNCIFFTGNSLFEINPQSDKNFQAHNEIHITADFHDKSDDSHSHHYGSSNKSTFEVVYMNAWWPNVFIKYDKLEIGNNLPNTVQERLDNFFAAFENNPENYHPTNTDPTKINPFLEWEIKVETTFKHLGSGFEKTIFGFYYEDFERDYTNEEWNPVATPYIFRTRYAPPHAGKWQARTKITVGNGAEIYLSDPYFFKVVEGGQHGFVKVHENKRNLKLEDRMIFPVGHNMGWAGFWHQDDAKTNYKTKTEFMHWQDYQNAFEEYSNLGSRYARLHLHNGIMDIEWEYAGNYKNRLHFAWEMDKLIDLFEDKDMLVQITLMMQHQLGQTNLSSWRLDYNAYSYPEEQIWGPDKPCDPTRGNSYFLDLGITNVVDFISGETNGVENFSHKYLKQRLRYLISRYCYSTSIYQIDINSEINLAIAHQNLDYHDGNGNYINVPENESQYYKNSIDTRTKIYHYNKVMSEYIKNDLNHTEHLLSVNYSDWPLVLDGTNTNLWEGDNTFSLPTIDIVGLNTYSNSPQKLYVSGTNHITLQLGAIWEVFGYKPIILGEVGGLGPQCWSDYAEMPIMELMTFGFVGIAGFNTWHALDNPMVYPPVKRASNHMNGDDVINTLSEGYGNWILGQEVNDASGLINDNVYQHFYYRSSNRIKVVGFIKNNTYNAYTYGQNNCSQEIEDKYQTPRQNSWQENDFKIRDLLPNHNYRIHYYEFWDYHSSDCFNANIITGNQKLKHPDELWKILWYVAFVEDCMNGIIMQEQNNEYPSENQNFSNSNIESTLKKDTERKAKTSEKEQKDIETINIVPHPVIDKFKLEISADNNISSITLLDLNGQIISANLQTTNYIDLSFLSAGIYLLQIQNGDVYQIIKLIKQ